MSAYIVDDSTINEIIHALRSSWLQRRLVPKEILGGLLPLDAHRSNPGYEVYAWGLLGQAMRDMNERGIGARYRGQTAEDFGHGPYVFSSSVARAVLSVPELVKKLDCYLYQCLEGDVPEEPLFKALDEIRARLCRAYVHGAKEYEAAAWG